MRKIIFYSLKHYNNPTLDRSGYEIIDVCPIEWFKNDLWAENVDKNKFICYITCVVYEDKDAKTS